MSDDIQAEALAETLAEARRRVESQVKRFDDLRTRAIALLAAGAVVTGLFGVQASTTGDRSLHLLMPVGGVIAFMLLAWMVVVINAPQDWSDGPNITALITATGEVTGLRDYRLRIAKTLRDDVIRNEEVLAPRTSLFTGACVALTLEVVLWGASVIF